MAQVGTIETIKHPVLKDVRQSSLIKFDTEYTHYLKDIESVNSNRDATRTITAASIRQCMEPELLNSLCIIGVIDEATTLEDATDENVKKWFDERLEDAPEDIVERVRSALSTVHYRTDKNDPSGAALAFIVNVVSALDRYNASEIVGDREACKGLIQKMIEKLEPVELRERIRESRECWSAENKSNIAYFQSKVRAIAVEVNQGELARARIHAKGKKRNHSDLTNDKAKRLDSNRNTSDKKYKRGQNDRRGSSWNLPCLNKNVCSGIHRISECPVTSDEKKKELLDEYRRSARHTNKGKQVRMQAMKDSLNVIKACSEADRFDIRLEDKIPSIALGDTGSDESAIDARLFREIKNEDSSIRTQLFKVPQQLTLAISCGKETIFTASKRVYVSVTIFLPGSKLPLRVRNVPFLVVDHDMEECIIGRDFLQRIGFNLHDHLIRSREKIDGKKFEELNVQPRKLASLKYTGLQYDMVEDDPIPSVESIGASIGKDDPSQLEAALQEIVQKAKTKGLSSEGQVTMHQLIMEYADVFRINLCNDDTAKVQPLQIQLKKGARAQRSPQRRYGTEQRKFLADTVRKLESVGAIYKNPSSRWASPALAVAKPGGEEFRFTVDLRGPNAQTDPIVSAMPHLESLIQSVEGSTVYAKIDMAHAYWQLPLAKESQELMSIQTPLGVYSSTRLLQGSTDAGNHFQAVTADAFAELSENMLHWIDDFMLHAPSEEQLLKKIKRFLELSRKAGFKLHAKKCDLFLMQAKFCGRIISKEGVRYDPSRLEALMNMSIPNTGADLQQFICATNWMRTSIPNYATAIHPLHELMESIYKSTGKRTKRSVSKTSLSGLWGENHDRAFAQIKKQIAHSTTLGLPKPNHQICLFTDASESHWAAIFTQVPQSDKRKSLNDQKHEPLAFLSGAFTGSCAQWSVPEKEGFAVVEAMTKMDFLTYGREVTIFTDHANLVYIYDPFGKNPGIARHTACKLMRWALKLSGFRYVIEHVSGDSNVWADMLTRWAVGPKSTTRPRTLKILLLAPVSPSTDDSLDWPSYKELEESQQKSADEVPKRFKLIDGLLQDTQHVVYLPRTDNSIKLRVMIAGHTGISGHRGYRTTQKNIGNHFWWQGRDEDIESFTKSCLHCLATESGDIVPRPLGHAMHASRRNEIIHFDYCYITPGDKGHDYVLILKDDFSGYVWLMPAMAADADHTAGSLMSWFAAFGTVQQWVSDQGTHFKNQVVKTLRQRTNSSHHFTLAYTPWTNGTVEVVCRELLRTLKALTSEYQLSQKDWVSVLPVVQSVLNNSPLQRMNGHCPLTVFTGLPQDTPLTTIKTKGTKPIKLRTISEVRIRQLKEFDALQSSLEGMHRYIKPATDKKRAASISRHNRKTNVKPINFSVGDFVLRAVSKKEKGSKISLTWTGPYRVTVCKSEYIFEVQHLSSGDKKDVHGRRLKFFRNKDYKVTQDLLDHIGHQESELMIVDEFRDIRMKSGELQLYTQWKGLDESENTWESLQLMNEDVPTMVKEYVSYTRTNGTIRQRKVVSKIDL